MQSCVEKSYSAEKSGDNIMLGKNVFLRFFLLMATLSQLSGCIATPRFSPQPNLDERPEKPVVKEVVAEPTYKKIIVEIRIEDTTQPAPVVIPKYSEISAASCPPPEKPKPKPKKKKPIKKKKPLC